MRGIAVFLSMAIVIGLAAGCRHDDEKSTPAGSMDKAFVSGGEVELMLESGSYDVKPSPDNRVHVQWDEAGGKEAKVSVTANGRVAEVRTENTPNNFHVTIAVPTATNLYVRMTGGDLTVGAVKGNKDIEVKAGNVTVNVGKSSEWAQVEASVTTGNLEAPAFQSNDSGLFRSLHWSGPGQYRLHASLTAGNLRLES